MKELSDAVLAKVTELIKAQEDAGGENYLCDHVHQTIGTALGRPPALVEAALQYLTRMGKVVVVLKEDHTGIALPKEKAAPKTTTPSPPSEAEQIARLTRELDRAEKGRAHYRGQAKDTATQLTEANEAITRLKATVERLQPQADSVPELEKRVAELEATVSELETSRQAGTLVSEDVMQRLAQLKP